LLLVRDSFCVSSRISSLHLREGEINFTDYVNRLDIARRVAPQRAIHKIKQDHRSQERLCSLIRVIYDPLIYFVLAERANRFNNAGCCSDSTVRAFRDSTPRGETLHHLRPYDDSNIIALRGVFPRSRIDVARVACPRRREREKTQHSRRVPRGHWEEVTSVAVPELRRAHTSHARLARCRRSRARRRPRRRPARRDSDGSDILAWQREMRQYSRNANSSFDELEWWFVDHH